MPLSKAIRKWCCPSYPKRWYHQACSSNTYLYMISPLFTSKDHPTSMLQWSLPPPHCFPVAAPQYFWPNTPPLPTIPLLFITPGHFQRAHHASNPCHCNLIEWYRQRGAKYGIWMNFPLLSLIFARKFRIKYCENVSTFCIWPGTGRQRATQPPRTRYAKRIICYLPSLLLLVVYH